MLVVEEHRRLETLNWLLQVAVLVGVVLMVASKLHVHRLRVGVQLGWPVQQVVLRREALR
jgi:hypothetical protein